MDMKQPASLSVEDAEPATAGVWGCLLFFVLLLVVIGALAVLAGGSN